MIRTKFLSLSAVLALMLGVWAERASAGSASEVILRDLGAQVTKAQPEFQGFSGKRGYDFYHAVHEGGRANSCTDCHGADPKQDGAMPNGSPLPPFSAEVNPNRLSSKPRFDGTIRGCCNVTLGRDCAALNKGDIVHFMLGK